MCGRLLLYASSVLACIIPRSIPRTKLHDFLALLKSAGCFVCSKGADESLTTMAVKPSLRARFKDFHMLYDIGVMTYASFNQIPLTPEDLDALFRAPKHKAAL